MNDIRIILVSKLNKVIFDIYQNIGVFFILLKIIRVFKIFSLEILDDYMNMEISLGDERRNTSARMKFMGGSLATKGQSSATEPVK